MNYVGEMMLYSSFGVLCQKTEVWYIFAYVWGIIFSIRMLNKDYSLSKKVDWPEYAAQTWIYVPKIYNSAIASILFYTVFIGACYYTW